MIDHPGFGLPNLGKTDQSGRQLGLFIKGNIAKINYRFSIDKPFVEDEKHKVDVYKSSYYPTSNHSFKGYAYYSFFDEEKFKSSYVGMSYLGKKKILNVGAGFDLHPESMASLTASKDTIWHDKKLFGLDLFVDYPFANKSVFTLYSSAFFYDFGPNHIRTYGAMNPYKKGSIQQGGGNSHYNVGTGNIFYTMTGYILPEKWQFAKGIIQPTMAIHYKDFEALNEAAFQYDIGVNYYISGHNAKLSLQYSNWAVYNGNTGHQSSAKIDQRRGMLVFMTQFYI